MMEWIGNASEIEKGRKGDELFRVIWGSDTSPKTFFSVFWRNSMIFEHDVGLIRRTDDWFLC